MSIEVSGQKCIFMIVSNRCFYFPLFIFPRQNCKQSLYQRQRNILHLISQYLDDFGLKQTKIALISEARLSNEFKVCDNIDLDTIYLDYCSYYHLKFGKQPKITKRIEVNEATLQANKTKPTKSKSGEMGPKKADASHKDSDTGSTSEQNLCDLIEVVPCFRNTEHEKCPELKSKLSTLSDYFTGEWLDLAYTIETYVGFSVSSFLFILGFDIANFYLELQKYC